MVVSIPNRKEGRKVPHVPYRATHSPITGYPPSPPSAGDFGPARRIIRIPIPEPLPQQLPEPEKEVKQDEPVPA